MSQIRPPGRTDEENSRFYRVTPRWVKRDAILLGDFSFVWHAPEYDRIVGPHPETAVTVPMRAR
jgi:hypothetical protein